MQINIMIIRFLIDMIMVQTLTSFKYMEQNYLATILQHSGYYYTSPKTFSSLLFEVKYLYGEVYRISRQSEG